MIEVSGSYLCSSLPSCPPPLSLYSTKPSPSAGFPRSACPRGREAACPEPQALALRHLHAKSTAHLGSSEPCLLIRKFIVGASAPQREIQNHNCPQIGLCSLWKETIHSLCVLKKKLLKQKISSSHSFELREISKHYFPNLCSVGNLLLLYLYKNMSRISSYATIKHIQ